MKKPALAAVVFLGVLSLVVIMPAQTAPARPGAKAPGKAQPEEKAEPVIEGMTIPRADGRFLGLTLQEGKYRLTFYDDKKEPTQADAVRAVARWPNPHGPGQNRTVLNRAGDGTYFLGAQFVRGPHAFKLTLVLVLSHDGEQTESYTVDFRG